MSHSTTDLERILIPVIGMHRSGTSAVAGALKHLGIDFGTDLMGPAPSNPRGHFEDLTVVAIHESLLHSLGCRWDDVQLRGDWELTKVADIATQRVGKWLSRLKGSGPFGIKDPRMCLFSPIWHVAALRTDIELRPLIVMREHDAIAHSLARRNKMSPEHTRDLLVRYGEGIAEWWTTADACTIIHFEDLIENPREELELVMRDLGFPAERDMSAAMDFIDGSLVHG
jgi:hypothetical protein